MKKRILLAGIILLLQGNFLFAKDSVLDFNLQVGANTTLSSVTDYADNMKKLADGVTALDNANNKGTLATYGNAGRDLDKAIKGYNGAAVALSSTLANLRFGVSFQLGLKPLLRPAAQLALGLSSGLRMGVLENVVDASQGSIIFFDVPVHAYVGLTLVKILRFDGLLGMVFSASSKELADFTAKPVNNAVKGSQLIQDGFNAPKLDMVLRASLSMFYLELNGAINLQNPENLSFFRLGFGINIDII